MEILLNDAKDEDDNETPAHQYMPLVVGYIQFIFFWQFAFRVSDVGITGFLAFFAGFLLVLACLMKIQPLQEIAEQCLHL